MNLEYVLLTCDEPTTDLCFAKLKNEVDNNNIRIIRNIYPISAACNMMLYEAMDTIKWIVMVDSDFILYEGFHDRIIRITRVVENSIGLFEKIWVIQFSLYDIFEEKIIGWCKVYNRNLIRKSGVIFKNIRGCDRQFCYEMKELGYEQILDDWNNPIGDHILNDKGILFSKYSEKLVKEGLKNHDATELYKLIQKIERDNSVIHAAALIGLYSPRISFKERNRFYEKCNRKRILIESSSNQEVISRAKKIIRYKTLYDTKILVLHKLYTLLSKFALKYLNLTILLLASIQ